MTRATIAMVVVGCTSLWGCDHAGAAAEASGGPAPTEGGRAPATPRGTAGQNGFDGMPPVGTRAVCPVMGTEFAVGRDTTHSEYGGKTYVFCCAGCKPQFDADPKKYLGS